MRARGLVALRPGLLLRRLGAVLPALAALQPAPAWARWATEGDVAAAIVRETDSYDVSADGTFRETVEQEAEILKEQARGEWGTKRIYYNATAGSFKLLAAQIINGEKRQDVEASMIEDKPLASQGAGFDQYNQVMIAYPGVGTGSRTWLKYRTELKDVPFPDFFSHRLFFDGGAVTRERKMRFDSALPLFVETHDPEKCLEVRQGSADGKYWVEVRLTRPLIEMVVDEESPSFVATDRTWVVVSSLKSHQKMIEPVVPKYEAVLNSPLPAPFQAILEKAGARTGAVDRINTVTSELAQIVRYMGDWRSVKGGWVPRSLAVVADTRFGDCKDFAAVTGAILRKLGMNAEVAWVERDLQPNSLPKLPLGEAFNHAILRVRAEGRVFWVDPTNLQSFAQGTFPDVIGRSAVVVAPPPPAAAASGPVARETAEEPGPVEQIPPGLPGGSRYEERYTVRFEKDGDAEFDFRLRDFGRMAISMTAAGLQYSKSSLEHILLTALVTPSHIKDFEIAPIDLRSRVVGDLDFGVKVRTRNSFTRTSTGLGYPLPVPGAVEPLMTLRRDGRVSDYFLGQPYDYERRYEIRNVSVIGRQYKGCVIRSPWANVSRSFKRLPDGIQVSETYESLTDRLPNADIESPAFSRFQDELERCFDRIQLIFSPKPPKAAKAPGAGLT